MYHFSYIFFASQKLMVDFQYIQICFKQKIPANIFNKYWITSMKKTSMNTIRYYRLNLKFNELSYDGHYGESIALALKDYNYARINLNKLLWNQIIK
jgi:hypothetical protein